MTVDEAAAAPGDVLPGDVLVEVRDLHTHFPVPGGWLGRTRRAVRAVDGVSFAIRRGETFGLVGESGSGKTTLARTIMRLERHHAGQVMFEGEDILAASRSRMKALRPHMQMVFQDPMGSLDPRMRVFDLIAEGLVIQGALSRAETRGRVGQLAETVGLRREHLARYPHEFSGGQRQRIGIARALALRPKFVLADEPVSALDVSVQAQVLNLLSDLQQEFGLTYLFIAHDLAVIEHVSDRVGVMYFGRLVEVASAGDLYADPLMPYTQALLSAVPGAQQAGAQHGGGRRRIVLQGDVPSPLAPPSGCPFRTRCWVAQGVCAEQEPPLRQVRPGHWAACHFAGAPAADAPAADAARQGDPP